jgi:hypothetical protein
MRYWAYFAAKLAGAAPALYGLLVLLVRKWPSVPRFSSRIYQHTPSRFGLDLGFTLAVLMWFLVCNATLYLIIWDQRYRCRVCLRRLRMPIETGSWGRMLQLGRPRIEYICAYGHGTLKEEELQISGLENPEWTPHSDDLWDELCASSKEPGDQP